MNDSETADRIAPIVTRLPTGGLMVDASRQPEDQIERLIRGEGELARQVRTVISQSRAELGINTATEIVPIVLLYRRADPDYVVITPQTSPAR